MRFLCLHGMGTNSKIFEVQTAKLRLDIGGDHEYVFIDGAVPTIPAPGVKQFSSEIDEFLCFARENHIEEYQTLYHDLTELVIAEGPFDGIMAFSEGAGVAASLIVDYLRREKSGASSPFNFKCAIFFCAANPIDADEVHEGRLRILDYRVDRDLISIPTAHVWARIDDLHAGFGQNLSRLCAVDMKEEYIHDLGHTIPGAQSGEGVFEATRTIKRTIERAIGTNL